MNSKNQQHINVLCYGTVIVGTTVIATTVVTVGLMRDKTKQFNTEFLRLTKHNFKGRTHSLTKST